MQTELHYAKAPIVEAIVDLRVVPVADFDVEKFRARAQSWEQDARIERISVNQLQFSVGFSGDTNVPVTQHNERTEGFEFTQKSKHQNFEARLDGFSFRRTAPYGQWQDFRDQARKLWDAYRALYPFEGVVRAALRYINRIDMPLERDQSELGRMAPGKYLHVLPTFPFKEPSQINGFFLQMQFWQADLECNLIVNEAMVPSPSPDVGSIVLDFDLFQERFERPWLSADDAQIWDFLEQLRVRKNELFQSSITPQFEERIQ